MIPGVVPHPSRWECEELARRLVALEAAERELAEARAWLGAAGALGTDEERFAALDRYMLALTERNTLRDGRP